MRTENQTRVKVGGGKTYSDEQAHVPPVRCLFVLPHQFYVYVRFLTGAVLVLLPDFFATMQVRIHNERRDGGKREAIGHGEGGAVIHEQQSQR